MSSILIVLDFVPGLLEHALSWQVFRNLPSDHVWSGSSAQSERGRWNRRRTTCVTSACPLPRTPPTGPTGEYGSDSVRGRLYHVCSGVAHEVCKTSHVRTVCSVYDLYSMCPI